MAEDRFDIRIGEDIASGWRQLQDLAGDAARIQARWAKAVATAARAVGRGQVSGASDLLKDVSREYERYLRDLGKLNVEYARNLQRLAVSSGERLTGAVEDAARSERMAADAPRRAPKRTAAKRTAAKRTPRRTAANKNAATKAAAKAPARARRTPPARG